MRKEPVVSEGITWVGLDAHKKAINVAVRLPGIHEFQEWIVANEPRALKRLAKKLVRDAPGEVRCCYEAGPLGYSLQRQLMAASSLVCEVIAPALIPRKSGDRVKTDRRDARKLCELFQAGLLTEVRPPTEDDEAVRDLCRSRAAVRNDLTRARHRLAKWLLRRAIAYTAGKKPWTQLHRRWLGSLRFERTVDQWVFDDHLLAIDQLEQRRDALEARLDEVAQRERYRAPVAALRCLRGFDTVTSLGLLAELFDVRRFESPRQLMSYLGMTPSEYSSGGVARRGGITKAGNSRARQLLIEAAWHCRHPPAVGVALRHRREGQPAPVIALADKAQHRLYRRYHRFVAAGKPANKAIVAVARELAGFVWGVLRELEVA